MIVWWILGLEVFNFEKLLNNTKEGDIIVYCDSGSSFNYYAKDGF